MPASSQAPRGAALSALMDRTAEALYDEGGSVHAKALEAILGFGDGTNRTATGDALYRAMKADKRFVKRQPGVASWALAPSAKRAISRARSGR